MSIIIGAESSVLIGDRLIDIFNAVDYRVFNLEIPLTDVLSPIEKCGPSLRADCSTVNAKKMGVSLLTMANNHVMEDGVRRLVSTIDFLKKNGLSYFIGNARLAVYFALKE